MKDWFFIIILGILAVALAGTAAFFSITGLAKLFVGAATAIIILGSILEVAKLIIISYLHQYWKKINVFAKIYSIAAVLALMFITSVGIYGFLSSGYSKTSVDLKKMDSEIALIENKKELKEKEVARFDLDITAKRGRISDLSSVRKQQETRLDSLYNKGWYRSAKKTETIIEKADSDISKLYAEINTITATIQSLNEQVNEFDIQILEANNGELMGDVGPLKYISKITGLPMDNVVNYLMIILMFVFDPLAVMMVIAVNSIISNRRNRIEEEQKLIPQPKVTQKKPRKKFVPKSYGMKKYKPEPKIINSNSISNISEEKKQKYISLLEILYKNGNKDIGDEIPSIIEYMTELGKANINVTDKEVKDFLILCNLMDIIKIKGKDRTFEKDYIDGISVMVKINQ